MELDDTRPNDDAAALSASQSATRSKILDAAADLFYEKGVHAVGVNEIAARAHASKLSMYRYFPSKTELVESMLEEHSDHIHAWLLRKTADAPEGQARVLSVFDLLIAWFAQPGYRGCTVVNTVTDTRADPVISAIARRHLARYREMLETRLTEAGITLPRTLARQLLLLIEGASVVSAIEGSPDSGADARLAAEHLLTATLSAQTTAPPPR
ncbi:TetR/AcrR family transcriptional regulator [Nocardia sp. NEAU-G5]|uniref:TetR/AcrR family transcriptional regulator n=1 Tax=Nocardia albiluteola TaxID=2842303 RepID=A0ABS6BA27_9NOCA|nr:TetR/AcrR family transcriptional regulator [Nocardia albiluteola]MBU3067161.1 TetR/AcrR family transcriptional regulator [Nocardia albiluteola]